MNKVLRARMGKKDEGFSLIELMIVVLIIAILIAIAIPTFLGARTKSQDRASQVGLRQGLLTAKSFYTDNESYAGASQAATETAYEALEPSIDFVAVTAPATGEVGVLASANDVVMVSLSKSGTYFCIAETVTGGTTYGQSATLASVNTVAGCTQGW